MLHRRAVQQEQPPFRFSPELRAPPQLRDAARLPLRDAARLSPRDTARLPLRDAAHLPPRDTALRCHVGCARSAGMDDYVPSRRTYTTCTQCTTGVLSKNTTIVIGALRGLVYIKVYILFRGLSKNKKYVEDTSDLVK